MSPELRGAGNAEERKPTPCKFPLNGSILPMGIDASVYVLLQCRSTQVAESDFTKLLADAEADESSAQDACPPWLGDAVPPVARGVARYDKLTQDNKVSKTTKQSDAKGKGAEVKQLEVALGNYKENKVRKMTPWISCSRRSKFLSQTGFPGWHLQLYTRDLLGSWLWS